MQFIISSDIFKKLPDLYIGVVVAHGIDNHQDYPLIDNMLNKNMKAAQHAFQDVNVKQDEHIIPYREAFRKIGINPNRFPCSAEALFKRLSKGKDLPHINPLVDLNNAISIKYTVPMGTHSLDNAQDDMMMRLSQPGDQFISLGKTEVETPDEGEVVYAADHEVRPGVGRGVKAKPGRSPLIHRAFSSHLMDSLTSIRKLFRKPRPILSNNCTTSLASKPKLVLSTRITHPLNGSRS